MSNIEFFAEALAYHTKGREAVLRGQADIEEKKDCGCDCDGPCSCAEKVKESTDVKNDKNSNGIDDKDENEPKDNVVRKIKKMAKEDTDLDEAENKDKGSWSSDSGWKKAETIKKDEFGNVIKTKNMAKRLAKQAKKTMEEETMDEGALAGHYRAIRAMKDAGKSEEEAHKVAKQRGAHPNTVKDVYGTMDESAELIDAFADLMEMFEDLQEMMDEDGLDINEAVEEWNNEDSVEENFGNMSKTKRAMAAKKAALTKARTGNFGGGRPKKGQVRPVKLRSIQPRRR